MQEDFTFDLIMWGLFNIAFRKLILNSSILIVGDHIASLNASLSCMVDCFLDELAQVLCMLVLGVIHA